jgi:hypothetical protein
MSSSTSRGAQNSPVNVTEAVLAVGAGIRSFGSPAFLMVIDFFLPL